MTTLLEHAFAKAATLTDSGWSIGNMNRARAEACDPGGLTGKAIVA